MNISLSWLEAFLRRPLDAREVANRLAMLGATVDAVEPLAPGLEDIIIGQVETVVPHPNADRLRLCTVHDGTAERRQVVCGASNVAAGRKYPFAPIGASLPGGLKIEKRKLRGVASEGMLCSARELGLGQDHEGILELDTTAEPGTPLLTALPLADQRLVVDVTPNRPDLLGHKGVARELAASFGTGFRLPEIPGTLGPTVPSPRKSAADTVARIGDAEIRIEHPFGCRRFLAALIRGVQVAPSPSWLARRIEAIGMRPINNVVDATNYVMFELNQPLHAYDLARLEGPALVARLAAEGETLVTLDDVPRTLTPDMLVIADDARAVGVAGVMGAAHVEVSSETSDVLLECAWFDPRSIRRTRRALGISSEASYRFERGVDLWNGPEAIRRAVEIILATAGGTLEDPLVDVYPAPLHPPRIFLRLSRVAQVLGVDLPWADVERTLVAIGATVLSKPADGRIAVDVPGWRPDLETEIDLVEEIARIHGYDNLPSELRPYRGGQIPDAPSESADTRIRQGLAAWGLLEASTLPLGDYEAPAVRLLNPLAQDQAALRPALLPALVRQAELNWRSHTRDIRLFEIGTVFLPGEAPGQLPREERKVAGVISGGRHPNHWTGAPPDFDLWDLKGLLDHARSLAVPGGMVQVEGSSWVVSTAEGQAGWARRLDADSPPWAAPLFGFELTIEASPRPGTRFTPLPTTPAAERDLALALPPGVEARAVLDGVRQSAGGDLERVGVTDEYRGDQVGEGSRSIVLHLVFRAADRTLEKAEVERSVQRVLMHLERELGVHLREA